MVTRGVKNSSSSSSFSFPPRSLFSVHALEASVSALARGGNARRRSSQRSQLNGKRETDKVSVVVTGKIFFDSFAHPHPSDNTSILDTSSHPDSAPQMAQRHVEHARDDALHAGFEPCGAGV